MRRRRRSGEEERGGEEGSVSAEGDRGTQERSAGWVLAALEHRIFKAVV